MNIEISHKINIRHPKQSGFTLLEMIVSVGIFAVVAVIAVGSLVRITGLNRQAQALQSAMNNINFALESMTREMRVGTNFYCGADSGQLIQQSTLGNAVACPSGANFVAFRSSDLGTGSSIKTCNLIHVYWFSDPTDSNSYIIKKAQQSDCDETLTFADATSIIDDGNVDLTGYSLKVVPGRNGISWINIGLIGYSGAKLSERNSFDVETGVSQRVADIPS